MRSNTPTEHPHFAAKKALTSQSRAYRKRYDFNSKYLMPVDLYEAPRRLRSGDFTRDPRDHPKVC
ncbi:hypothetical protein C8039_08395 [Halogeometricum sp. wsp3]|nr:hypothetical protein C8039_08395 [Halogeometricum sp. wsp3]